MKVLFDHQIFSTQEYGGISRAFAETYSGLKSLGIDCEISAKLSNNHYLPNIGQKKFFKNNRFWGKLTLMERYNRIFSIDKLKKGDYDIFHPTYYDPYFLDYLGKKPFVLSVYDLIHEKFLKDLASSQQTLGWKKLLIKKAAKIVAISETTKNDLMEIYGVKDEKIKVVYLASSLEVGKGDNNFKLPDKYILYVGGRQNYKNFDFFLRSIEKIMKRNNLSLFCAGGGSFSDKELAKLETLGIKDRVFQKEVTDRELVSCYGRALCFAFPSVYEGFGIPVLESFACGCPVVLSDIGCFREIAGDDGVYFNPESEASIIKTIEKSIFDNDLRKKSIANGYTRLKEFSWEKSYRQILRVYESVI